MMVPPSLTNIPVSTGSYAFELVLGKPARICVGRLGEFLLPAGSYIYLGSACGSGGLRARLAHHIQPPPAPPRWHVDFLRHHAQPAAVWWTVHPRQQSPSFRLECRLSHFFEALPGASAVIPGFGASDCLLKCKAHLWHFNYPDRHPLLEGGILRRRMAGISGTSEVGFHLLIWTNRRRKKSPGAHEAGYT